jgi:nucleoside-diphosphate-sugar epimerase
MEPSRPAGNDAGGVSDMFENRFGNQTAIVTGGASGIGKAIVQRLAAEGAHVTIFDVEEEAMAAVAKELSRFALRSWARRRPRSPTWRSRTSTRWSG